MYKEFESNPINHAKAMPILFSIAIATFIYNANYMNLHVCVVVLSVCLSPVCIYKYIHLVIKIMGTPQKNTKNFINSA